MVIVLIRRCVRADRENEFLQTYHRQKPSHPDFIEETLTRVLPGDHLPEPMRSLSLGCPGGCVTYVNVARWKSAESFEAYFKPQTTHDASFECADRLRAVLDVVT